MDKTGCLSCPVTGGYSPTEQEVRPGGLRWGGREIYLETDLLYRKMISCKLPQATDRSPEAGHPNNFILFAPGHTDHNINNNTAEKCFLVTHYLKQSYHHNVL